MTEATESATVLSDGFNRLNSLTSEELVEILFESCHLPVRAWALAVDEQRPYSDIDALISIAQDAVDLLTPEDVVAAHKGLRRIGSRLDGETLENKWSRQESALVKRNEETRLRLEPAHEAYETAHGHVFLISATGLTTEQILAEIIRRTNNTPQQEFTDAKEELRKLVEVRLRKVLTSLGESHSPLAPSTGTAGRLDSE